LDGLLLVGLESAQNVNELQEIEFGRGFSYHQPLSIGIYDLPSVMLNEIGRPGSRGSQGHPGEEGGMDHAPTTQLKNRYQIFVEDEDGTPKDEAIPASKKEKGTQQQVTAKSTAKKQRRVVVVGDSLLRGTEAAICRPDITAREVCCLPGAMIKDVTNRIPKLFNSKDVHPFLLIHVGTNDTARKDLPTICKDFEELGKKVKELDAQVVFSSILPVDGHGTRRWNRILDANNWLRRWCRQQGFGFLDHGVNYLYDGLLARDGLHLNKPGKHTFARRLATLIRRALN
ncbi:unnamed protein product, partial [Ranitomeya imitator]